MQTSLPFDKREYAAAMKGLETFVFEGESARNQKILRKFFIKLFRGEYYDATAQSMRPISAPDGTTTKRQAELAEIFDVERTTIHRRLKAGVKAGIIDQPAIDTDEPGRKRTTITFVWSRILPTKVARTDGPKLHEATTIVARRNDQSCMTQQPKLHDATLDIYRNAHASSINTSKQLLQDGGQWLLLEKQLADYGLEYPRKAAESAKRSGLSPNDVSGLLEGRRHSARDIARHLIHGSPLAVRRRVESRKRSPAEVEEDIIFRGRRAGKDENTIAAELAAALGEL